MDSPPKPPSTSSRGVLFALLAFGSWGIVPLFWRLLAGVPATELLAHRVAWSLVVVTILLSALGGGREAFAALRSPRRAGLFLLSSALIAANWGIFIWAIAAGRLSEASLGYFINPLANVVLGVVALGERLGRLQWLAVGLAAAAVGLLVFTADGVPWVALSLAGTFAVYGLIRKLAPLASLPGLFLETLLLAPFALGAIVWFEQRGGLLGRGDLSLLLLAAASGVVTSLPLVWFTAAARRLPLSTMGLFQYVAPWLQLLIAILIFGEQVAAIRWLAFVLIWSALAIHSVSLARRRA
ncbi:MAG: EamA family transporter RarD [Myxococcales bacterium]|nr:EamA family transporter RarD [Myxococcales bacterium]